MGRLVRGEISESRGDRGVATEFLLDQGGLAGQLERLLRFVLILGQRCSIVVGGNGLLDITLEIPAVGCPAEEFSMDDFAARQGGDEEPRGLMIPVSTVTLE